MEEIFKYLDYRDYLRDHYYFNKKNHSYFSFRYVAGKTGLDASFYVKVINKQKHISNSAILPLINFLKLSRREGSYFSALVHYNKAKTPEQEAFYLQKLLLLRKPNVSILSNDLYEYFTSWWNVAIRELLNIIPFKDDYNDLSPRLQPPITVQQAKRAIALLKRLGLIKEDENGYLRPTENFISTGDNIERVAIINSFQKAMAKLGVNALNLPKEERDISTLTISTSTKCIEMIKERISNLRQEIIELVRKEENVEEVYQINFQLFTLTKNRSKKNIQ
ncbi:MAG: TIGR02147 family protein [Chitinispirillaceae bacterium]|nr:TIGR02147 family protein [Chitinispirillaceae bacterium]